MANDFRRATHIHLCHSSKLPQDAFPSERLMFYDVLFIVHVIYCYLLYSNLRTCSSLSLSIAICQHMSTQKHVPLCSIFAAFLHGPCKPLPCNYLVYQDFACFPQV